MIPYFWLGADADAPRVVISCAIHDMKRKIMPVTGVLVEQRLRAYRAEYFVTTKSSVRVPVLSKRGMFVNSKRENN